MRYRYNLMLDIWRLIRGTLVPSSVDPSIQLPSDIGIRAGQFEWESVRHEQGHYEFDPGDYEPYVSSQPLLIENLPAKYGRDAFEHLMAAKTTRVNEITRVLQRGGIEPQASSASWVQIGQWVAQNIDINREPEFEARMADSKRIPLERKFRPLWRSLISDLGLLAGEHTIQLNSQASWHFWADLPVDKPARTGRDICLLLAPPPASGRWQDLCRVLPFDLVGGSIENLLSVKRKEDEEAAVETAKATFGNLFQGVCGDKSV